MIHPNDPNYPIKNPFWDEPQFPLQIIGKNPDSSRKRFALMADNIDIPERDVLLPNLITYLSTLNFDIVLNSDMPVLKNIINKFSLQTDSRLIILSTDSGKLKEILKDRNRQWNMITIFSIDTGKNNISTNTCSDIETSLMAQYVRHVFVFNCSENSQIYQFIINREFPDHRVLAMDWPSRTSPYLGNHLLIENKLAFPIQLRKWKKSIRENLESNLKLGRSWRQTTMGF